MKTRQQLEVGRGGTRPHRLFLFIFAFLCIWLKLAMGVVPTVMDLTLACDARPTNEQVRAYRFFEQLGTNWVFLRSVPTNRVTLTNVNVTVPHTYGVSASNVLGESDISAPYIAPSDPRPPSSLGIIQTSMVVPVPSTIAASTDLANWQEKQKFSIVQDFATNKLRVTFYVQPRDPVMFWQEWTSPTPPYPQ